MIRASSAPPQFSGYELRIRRVTLALSRRSFARLVGVSHEAVRQWEAGLATPSVDYALAAAYVLGTTVESLTA